MLTTTLMWWCTRSKAGPSLFADLARTEPAWDNTWTTARSLAKLQRSKVRLKPCGNNTPLDMRAPLGPDAQTSLSSLVNRIPRGVGLKLLLVHIERCQNSTEEAERGPPARTVTDVNLARQCSRNNFIPPQVCSCTSLQRRPVCHARMCRRHAEPDHDGHCTC